MKWRNRIKLPEINLPQIKWHVSILLYAITIIFSLLSMTVVYFDSVTIVFSSIIYAAAACGIGLSGCYLYQDLKYGINNKLKPVMEANPFTNRVTKDYRYRTVLFTYASFGFNLVFAVSNGIFGVLYDSIWFGSLSAYYIILSVMRFLVVQYDRKNSKIEKTKKVMQKELSVYQICGTLFLLLTAALGAAAVQMVYFDKSHSYPGTLIFAVAAYTFYKITGAMINKVKAGRLKSPLLITIRDIGYADALVSMLSLQTAMFVSFGSKEEVNKAIMNSMTAVIVCMIIFVMGIYMILSAQKQKKRLFQKQK